MARAGTANQDALRLRPPGQPAPEPEPDNHDGDKEWARQQYERNNMTTADIAKAVKRSQTTVVQWAGQGGWQRNKVDIAETVRASLIVKEEAQKATRIAIIERVNVEMQAKVLVEHRSDIKAMRQVQQSLWQELKDMPRDEDTVHDRITTFKKLSEASKTVILLERQAFGIQGAIEDPTEPKTDGGLTQAESAMTSLLGKFASVLGKAQSTPIATEVIDIKP